MRRHPAKKRPLDTILQIVENRHASKEVQLLTMEVCGMTIYP